MKIVIPGGTGQIGSCSRARSAPRGTRSWSSAARRRRCARVAWDGRTLGAWADEIDGADVVINLAGRSVNCRYTEANLAAMMNSRVDSTRAVGQAIARAARPPRVWLQMSTATIYAHRFDAPNDEATGLHRRRRARRARVLGLQHRDRHGVGARSDEATTPRTRKVALRTAMVMSPDRGGIFDVLLGLVRRGLGGARRRAAVRLVDPRARLRARGATSDRARRPRGPVNLASPDPLPQREFMAALRAACGARVGLPATRWMLEIGAFFLRTDTELCSRAAASCPGACSRRASPSSFPSGRRPRAIWSRAGAKPADDAVPPRCRDLSDTLRTLTVRRECRSVDADRPVVQTTTSIMRLGRLELCLPASSRSWL